MSPRGGTARAPLDHGDGSMGQPLGRLALPAELHRRRADDDRRKGVVGFERGERLDGLAEPLLVGQEHLAGVERIANPRPLERRERAAEHGGDLGDRIGVIGARPAHRVGRLLALGQQPREDRPGGLGDLDPVGGDEAVELAGQPRVQRHRARPLGARELHERVADVRVPHDLEPQLLAVD